MNKYCFLNGCNKSKSRVLELVKKHKQYLLKKITIGLLYLEINPIFASETVTVVQLVERQFVVLVVASSSLVGHPKRLLI